jgi:hypothetical protein
MVLRCGILQQVDRLVLKTMTNDSPKAQINRRRSRTLSSNAFYPPRDLSAVADAPDRTATIFADKKAAVFRDSDSNGATPNFAFGSDKAGYEVFVFAARFAGRFVERCAHDFVTSALHAVP